jgi:aspartate/methionine/tyrosine aminotransferase
VPVPLLEERDFRLDVEDLARRLTPRTRMILLNSPCNPTGGVLEPEDLQIVAELADRHGLWVLSDEIYSRHVYEGRHHSAWPLGRRTLLLDGFSKAYAMTGWRLGYGVLPGTLAAEVAHLLLHTQTCAPPIVQRAGLAALEGPDEPVQEMVAELRRRRDLFVSGLNRLPGFVCRLPRGAFYAFPNVRGTGLDSRDLARRLLEEAGVATLSGDAFGPGGEGYLRLSYANSRTNLEIALRRIEEFLKKL